MTVLTKISEVKGPEEAIQISQEKKPEEERIVKALETTISHLPDNESASAIDLNNSLE